MRIALIIIFALLSTVGFSQCDISVQDLVKKINCDSLIVQCPILGVDEIGIIEDLDLSIDCNAQEIFLSIDVGGVQESTTQDVSCFFDNTDTQLTEAEVDAFVSNNGYITNPNDADSDPTNELQDLSLSGNSLSIQNGNSVDLSGFLSAPNLDNDPNNEIQTLTPVFTTIYSEEYYAISNNGTTQSDSRNATITRTGTGRWTVLFSAPHPDGANYHPSVTSYEDVTNRDARDIQVVEGSQTANGFDIQITTGDNGTGADTPVDTPWSFGVDAPVQVLQSVTISN